MQEEATFLGVPCFTLRDNTERPVTVQLGTNTLLGLDPARIADIIQRSRRRGQLRRATPAVGRAGGRAGGGRNHRSGVTAVRPDAGRLTSAMRVLVTGGAGFIGSHITERLVVLGHEVRIPDNFVTGRRCNVQELLGDVELLEGDIQSYESVRDAVAGCEVVLHQAALPSVLRSVQDPLTSNATNVTGTLNVLLRDP